MDLFDIEILRMTSALARVMGGEGTDDLEYVQALGEGWEGDLGPLEARSGMRAEFGRARSSPGFGFGLDAI